MRSSKLWLLAVIALASALALYGATQVWVTLRLADGAAAVDSISVTGQQLNQSLSPVAIAALAAALALTIAGRVLRHLLGALVALLGAGIVAITATVLSDPLAASSGRVAEVTGLAGSSNQALVTGTSIESFVPMTLAAGAALVLLGLLVTVLSGRWKVAGRKYEAAPKTRATAGSDAEPDRISDWESMNEGEDPSEEPGEAPEPGATDATGAR